MRRRSLWPLSLAVRHTARRISIATNSKGSSVLHVGLRDRSASYFPPICRGNGLRTPKFVLPSLGANDDLSPASRVHRALIDRRRGWYPNNLLASPITDVKIIFGAIIVLRFPLVLLSRVEGSDMLSSWKVVFRDGLSRMMSHRQ